MSTQAKATELETNVDTETKVVRRRSNKKNEAKSSADYKIEELERESLKILEQIKNLKKDTAYGKYKELIAFLQKSKIPLKAFFDSGEKEYILEFGEKPELTKGIGFTAESTKPSVATRYRDTVDPRNKWAGRGKQPRWLVQRLEEGYKIDQFLVDETTE